MKNEKKIERNQKKEKESDFDKLTWIVEKRKRQNIDTIRAYTQLSL